ncbi:MAG: TatD family hydrolase [Bacteroidales bacterium]|nr:TatD family hydrolase [Bacteroidales bacterium]
MLLVDTHSHIYLEQYDADRTQVINAALEKGIRKILLPNIDTVSIEPVNQLVKAYPEVCVAMMGLHPTSVKENYSDEFRIIQKEMMSGNYIAIGEIGIDLYWDKSRLREQCMIFEQELDMALQMNKPVVIHARESFDVIFEILQKYKGSGLRGIFHAFSGSPGQALHVIENDFLIGIGGIVTYRKSGLDKVMQEVDLNHIVLETDSPFLPPVPCRGNRNEPAFLIYIAEAVARLKSVDVTEVASVTTGNACRLFGLNMENKR